MASPHASSFICLPYSNQSDIVLAHTVYFATCICSALIGIIGASVFLIQVVRSTHEAHPAISNSQKWILVMLALCDLLADVGVIGRSGYWLVYWRPYHLNQDKDFTSHLPSAIGGAVVENWVYFWYMATYFWTFFFAVDVYNSKFGGKWRLCCSHFFTWTFCLLFIGGSAASLWSCPPYLNCSEDRLCIISHFMSTIGPISIFMAALPLFYISTWRQMKRNAKLPSTGVTGPVADIWEKEKMMSKRKILGIILVFYICWSVNVVDGLLLILAHATSQGGQSIFYRHLYDSKYIYGIWMLEAVFNPLQGFFNAMAYGGLCHSFYAWLGRKLHPTEDPYVSSWSGEYIDVDFRVSRGKIHQSKRSQIKTPPEHVDSVE